MKTRNRPTAHDAEAGFTLVEALVAIVVLIFGLMAVTNLMIVAASSNTVANQGTAAVTSSTRVMDMIKSTSYANLPPGGIAWETAPGGGPDCNIATLAVTDWHCDEFIQGVGTIHTHWWITATPDPRLLHIRVRSEGSGSLAGARSRSEFTTFRACTNSDPMSGGCPTP
ncbi:MAG: prepilin-type N-terminal cleavage/methylation domain-containing protein [Acidobacteriota bacterium]|jgi:type II secretory pathway pseudopilin PulG|nr:prepilin-type N-terminal cleavage/methylation domain-containing protein [Acidobacteriota bacterium]